MADSRILPISSIKCGIKAEDGGGNGFGEGIYQADSTDTTAYRQLPIVQVQKPTFNITRESRLLSGRGSIKNASDTIITPRGGTVMMPFEMIATPKLFVQHLALVGQEHSESGSTIHVTEFDGSSNATSVGGTESSNIPHSVNLAYYPASGEGIKVCGVVCSDLGLNLDYGTNGGHLTMSGNYFSGFSNPIPASTCLEQTFSGTWTAPETSYYHIGGITTKTLDVEGNATQHLVLKNFQLNIANGVNRVGFNSNGNADLYALPEYVITGSITIKYDDEFDYGAGNNVIQDFLDGDTLSLSLQWGNGTVDATGEMNIDLEMQYTGDPTQDISENGVFHVLPFECVQNTNLGGHTNKEACKITVFNSESQSAW